MYDNRFISFNSISYGINIVIFRKLNPVGYMLILKHIALSYKLSYEVNFYGVNNYIYEC